MDKTPGWAPRLHRRHLLLGVAALGLAAADATLVEPRWIQIERLRVVIPGLGAAWRGARVVLLSDTHCGPHTPPRHIERAVDMANAQNPDAVLLLGDYVHRGARYIEPGIAPFSALRATHGVFGVLGNHDHWDGREASLRALRRANVQLVINRSEVLRRGHGELAIGGVGDLMEDRQELHRAFAGCPAHTPRILLSHNPDYAEQMPPDVRVDLMVSGHTHGGQVHLPLWGAPILPSRYGRKYQQGMVQGPHCQVYVTRGLSTIWPPVRFLCRPELTVLELA